jgi:hypothetical protein
MVTISHRIAMLLGSGCLIATASGAALADDHPAYISKQDVGGEIFKKPSTKREPDGTGTALDAVTFDSKGWKGHWITDGYTKLWVTYDPDAKVNAK